MHVPPSLLRQSALSFASLYAVWASLPTALLIGLFHASLISPIAHSQPSSPNSPPSDVRQLLEDARQRLIERGELPDPSADPDAEASPALANEAFAEYRLGPGDTVFVNVLRFPDLSFQGTIDLEGNLLVPLVGALNLNGFSIEQARSQIQVALDRYVIEPQVDVILIAQRPVQVTILGEVARPGLYPLPAPQLSVALVSAGGTSRLADLRSVRIRRSLPDGSILEQEVDLYTPLREALSVPEIQLANGDTIVIPTLAVEAVDEYDRNLIARTTLAQPQITVRVLNYATGGRGSNLGNLTLANGSTFVDALTTISPNLDAANIREIALIRFDVEQGEAITQTLDGKEALLGDTAQNPILENNDVIVIGRNLVNQITYFLNTFTQPFRDILGFLLFFDSLAESAESLFGPTGESESSDE
ncbi:MAG: polysaccharide export protein [Cyanobacteria bacterium CRU_2_1]|nr:polysaccharide export protein [Cyanobacteria bacterium RU_5_0]NJR61091.1 polysaccharide export protein [Cyanobacteria bacterium CRU_2_1]